MVCCCSCVPTVALGAPWARESSESCDTTAVVCSGGPRARAVFALLAYCVCKPPCRAWGLCFRCACLEASRSKLRPTGPRRGGVPHLPRRAPQPQPQHRHPHRDTLQQARLQQSRDAPWPLPILHKCFAERSCHIVVEQCSGRVGGREGRHMERSMSLPGVVGDGGCGGAWTLIAVEEGRDLRIAASLSSAGPPRQSLLRESCSITG